MDLLSPKQLEFILACTHRWNLAHGPVRSGKTVCTTFAFMHAVDKCPDSQIWMIGHTASTIYDNAIRLILEAIPDSPLAVFKPFCTWKAGARELVYKDKTISTVGAKDSGAIGAIQGKTMSLVYCDEMTLYPESIIDMIDTRLSNPHSMGFATMNPSHPSHKLKKWIDKAREGDKNYYELFFAVEDNPFLSQDYIDRIKNSLSGVFYKRNYLGEWCLAEGAIFDFFDRSIYVVSRPPRAAEYWIVGLDYGTNNAFAAVLIGVNTGRNTQDKPMLWVEKEYYWDSKAKGRQKLNSEYADDLQRWLEPYAVKSIYIDPSAAAFKLELQRRGMHPVDADNDVDNGIQKMTSDMKAGKLFVCSECTNLIREIEGYVWDPKSAERGIDEPLKQNDHACVTGDTLLKTPLGEISIKDLLAQQEKDNLPIELFNYKDQGVVLDEGMNISLTRKNTEIWELELENGFKLRATPDHKVLTTRGYIELQQLTPFDIVYTWNTSIGLKENST